MKLSIEESLKIIDKYQYYTSKTSLIWKRMPKLKLSLGILSKYSNELNNYNELVEQSLLDINNLLETFSPAHSYWKKHQELRQSLSTILEHITDIEEFTYSINIDIENIQTIPINLRTGQVCTYSNQKVYLDLKNNYIFNKDNDDYYYIGYWDNNKKKIYYTRNININENTYEDIVF